MFGEEKFTDSARFSSYRRELCANAEFTELKLDDEEMKAKRLWKCKYCWTIYDVEEKQKGASRTVKFSHRNV